MLKAVNLSRTIEYELSTDPDAGTENSTKWVLGALDSRILAMIKDKAWSVPVSSLQGGEGFASVKTNEANIEVVAFGLKGVKNFDPSAPYKTVVRTIGPKTYVAADPDFLAVLDSDWIEELASKIMELNSFQEEEQKN